MKTAKRKIPDFIIECLSDCIQKKIAEIVLPPQTILQPERNLLITNEITILLYDATWGYLRIKPCVLQTQNIKQMDLDNHQGLLLFIERNNNPIKDLSNRTPPPSYGFRLEYSSFIINRIEVYGQDFQLDENGKNIGKLLKVKDYKSNNVVIQNDSVIILYNEKGDRIIIAAEMGNLVIGFDEDYKKGLLSQGFMGYANYETPVMLELNYTLC